MTVVSESLNGKATPSEGFVYRQALAGKYHGPVELVAPILAAEIRRLEGVMLRQDRAADRIGGELGDLRVKLGRLADDAGLDIADMGDDVSREDEILEAIRGRLASESAQANGKASAESYESIRDAYRRGSAYVAARMAECDSLDALADELSGASARGDELSDDVLAAVLADLVPRKASPPALIRALAVALQARRVFVVADDPQGPRFLAWGLGDWTNRRAAEWARDAIAGVLSSEQGGAGARGPAVAARGGVGGEHPLQSPPIFPPPPEISPEIARGAPPVFRTHQITTPAADAVAPPSRSPGEGRGEMGDLGESVTSHDTFYRRCAEFVGLASVVLSDGSPPESGDRCGEWFDRLEARLKATGKGSRSQIRDIIRRAVAARYASLGPDQFTAGGFSAAMLAETGRLPSVAESHRLMRGAGAVEVGPDVWTVAPEPDPPCPHKAVVPGTGAEICPGCGERVARVERCLMESIDRPGQYRAFAHRDGAEFEAYGPNPHAAMSALDAKLRETACDPMGVGESARVVSPKNPPPAVGRLKRVWLTVDEFRALRGQDEAEVGAFRERAGLPRGTIMLEPEFDPSRHCYVATVECKEWDEVLLGDEVPSHPRHGR